MITMSPDDFGEIYHHVWEELLTGDFDHCLRIINDLHTMARSNVESNRLGAQVVLQDLAQKFHQHVRTQDLDVFEKLERHQVEQLMMAVEPFEPFKADS